MFLFLPKRAGQKRPYLKKKKTDGYVFFWCVFFMFKWCFEMFGEIDVNSKNFMILAGLFSCFCLASLTCLLINMYPPICHKCPFLDTA